MTGSVTTTEADEPVVELLVIDDGLPLTARALQAGLDVRAAAEWPEPGDEEPPKLAGFVHSTFSPLVAGVAGRCLQRRPESASPTVIPTRTPAAGLFPAGRDADADATLDTEPAVVGLVLVTALGDADSAAHVGAAVDAGGRIGPLFFFQSVPNAVLGHVAARWALTGPVVCVGGTESGLDIARLLLADGDADEVLLVELTSASTDGTDGIAAAVLVADGGPS